MQLTIAMLVHNGVWRDARVLKEARSLARAGHRVIVYGIGNEAGKGVEPFDVVLAAKPNPVAGYLRYLATGRVPLATLIAVVILIAAGLIAAWVVGPRLLAIVAAALVLVLGFAGAGFIVLRHSAPARALRGGLASAGRRMRPAALRLARRIAGERVVSHVYEQALRIVGDGLAASAERGARPDVIHLHDLPALTAAKRLRSRFGCPVVWDAHEIYEDLADIDPGRGRMHSKLIREAIPFINSFVTINDSIAAFYARTYPELPEAIVVKNATEQMSVPVDDGRLHAAAGVPRTQRILLFQGGFAPHRGLAQLVEAARDFPPDWSLVLMGWGSLEPELKALAAVDSGARRATRSVVFMPGVPQAELQQWSSGAALGAIPYENTGLNHLYCTPNKLWEYPNAGVPILATDLEELGSAIRQHHIGFLLPRDFRPADIVAALRAITPEALAAARTACLGYVTRDNWTAYADRLIALYARLPVGPKT